MTTGQGAPELPEGAMSWWNALLAARAPLGGFWAAVLKPLGEPFWGRLGYCWGLLRAFLKPLGGLLEVYEASWGRLGALWGPLGAESSVFEFLVALLGPSRSPLGPSWAPLGLSWGPPEPSWGRLGGFPGCLVALLRASWAVLERRKAEQARQPNTLEKPTENQRFWPLGAFLGTSLGPLGAS